MTAQNDSPEHTLESQLRRHLECLSALPEQEPPELNRKVAESLNILVILLRKIEQSMISQLEVLGKNHPRIKTMSQMLKNQGLLNIEDAMRAVLDPDSQRMTRLSSYSDLLLRWFSAVLAGVQATVLEVPNELAEALNPANWDLERRRWSSEEEAYWSHFKFVIKPEAPLRVGDRMKTMQADKTLEAYAILGGQKTGESKVD